MEKTIELLRTKLTKIQPILLWLMCAFYAQSFIRNGIRKFDVDGFWSGAFERWGYPTWFMIFIGVLETLGGIAILVPKVRHYGGITLAVVMLGALVTRLIHGTGWSDASYIAFFMISMLYISSHLEK
ncbi:MAG: DoxX family protein [Cyclobacteriaceae bacterium]